MLLMLPELMVLVIIFSLVHEFFPIVKILMQNLFWQKA